LKLNNNNLFQNINLNKSIIIDTNVSNGACRLYCYVLLTIDLTSISNTKIRNDLNLSSQTLANYWKELLRNKYITRKLKNNGKSKIGGYSYSIISDTQNSDLRNISNTRLLVTDTNDHLINDINNIVNALYTQNKGLLKNDLNLVTWVKPIQLMIVKDCIPPSEIFRIIPFTTQFNITNALLLRKNFKDIKNKIDLGVYDV